MNDILQTILENTRAEVSERKARVSLQELERAILQAPPPRSLRKSLATRPPGIIAEFKRRSPSKGWIKREARPEDIIPAYEQNGAAALSILTDNRFFGGSLDDVRRARPLTRLPILRKEFVVDAFQLYEARAAGADAILLIAAALTPQECRPLTRLAHEIGLEVLLEIHDSTELDRYGEGIDVLGVNNRDLRAFRTDPSRSEALFPALPAGTFPISESGLLDPAVATRLRATGYRGFLVGEAFMKEPQPGEALAAYIKDMTL